MVILFSRLRPKGTVVKKLSPLVFGIYLFQLNPVIWNTYLQGRASFVAQAGVAAGVGYVFIIAGGIFLSGLIVEFVRSRLAKIMRIPVLSQKIVALIQWVLQKVLIVLNLAPQPDSIRQKENGRKGVFPPAAYRSMPTAHCFFACCTAFSAVRVL